MDSETRKQYSVAVSKMDAERAQKLERGVLREALWDLVERAYYDFTDDFSIDEAQQKFDEWIDRFEEIAKEKKS